jgi:hypothetical protein
MWACTASPARAAPSGSPRGCSAAKARRRPLAQDVQRRCRGRTAPHHRGPRLLLAEDNDINREVALELLHGVGLHVDTAEDGVQALQRRRVTMSTTWC